MSDTKPTFDPAQRDRLTAQLVEVSLNARLSPAEEDEAAQLLRAALAADRAALAQALESSLSLPWSIGVKATGDAWPELKPTARRYIIAGLREHKNEAGRRYRLSLARGLIAVDAAASRKLAVEVCVEMLGEDGNGMGPRDRQCFANVFIGKGKPWILHFPIAEWQPAESDPLIAAAISACFNGGCPPFTQLALLKWIAEAGRIGNLSERAVAAIQRTVSRWQAKWKAELREAAIADLPEPIADAAAQPPEAPSEAAPEPREDEPEGEEFREQEEPPRRSRRESGPVRRGNQRGGEAFDLTAALRQIDAHVMSLRGELHQAQTALRGKPAGPSRGRTGRSEATETPEDIDALRRHNERLEETVSELRERMEELAADHEDHAAALEGGDPLKVLLGLKLREDHAVYEALRAEQQDAVVRTHLRDVLAHIFEVLEAEGVRFEEG